MNSTDDVTHKMQSLTEESKSMLELANSGQWDELVATEAKRRAALETFFNGLSDELRRQYAEQLRQFIQNLLELDQEVMSLSAKAKLDAAQEFQKLQSASKAAKLYSFPERIRKQKWKIFISLYFISYLLKFVRCTTMRLPLNCCPFHPPPPFSSQYYCLSGNSLKFLQA